jgi:hypothetical protein
MTAQIKRVVTGVDENGKSVIYEDAPLPPLEIGLMAGAKFFQVWGTEGQLTAPVTSPKPDNATFFPGPGGSRFGLLTFPPEPPAGEEPAPAPDDATLATLAAEASAALPGLMEVFEPDPPGMPQTVSIDYAVVVSGQLHLEVDDGVEVELPTGTVIVQNGARHAWLNHGDVPATLAYIILAPA